MGRGLRAPRAGVHRARAYVEAEHYVGAVRDSCAKARRRVYSTRIQSRRGSLSFTPSRRPASSDLGIEALRRLDAAEVTPPGMTGTLIVGRTPRRSDAAMARVIALAPAGATISALSERDLRPPGRTWQSAS